jgi:hypothetical protein
MAFTFHANTLGFGGQIDRPGLKPTYLPSQASLTLPPGGGFGESSVSNYSEDGISFYRAESRVFGSAFHDTIFRTYAHVSVLGLDVQGRIQADVLSATVTSINQRENGCTTESRISFDATIVGLVIDGQPIDVEFDPEPFRTHGTFGEFVDSFKDLDEKTMAARASAYNWPLEECQTIGVGGKKEFHVPKRCSTGIRATLLKNTTPTLSRGLISGLTRQGFSIEVAGFGLVHIGEVLLKAGRRRVNLLRVELGKTLADLPSTRVSMPSGGDEPRLHAVAMTEGAPEPMALVTGGGIDGGGYTFASGEGNGTDFLP